MAEPTPRDFLHMVEMKGLDAEVLMQACDDVLLQDGPHTVLAVALRYSELMRKKTHGRHAV